MNIPWKSTMKVWLSRKADLLRRAEELRKENLQLQERAESAQSAKLVAENLAEDLRKDKERLRDKVADQKKLTDATNRAMDQLRKRCEALEEENAKLR